MHSMVNYLNRTDLFSNWFSDFGTYYSIPHFVINHFCKHFVSFNDRHINYIFFIRIEKWIIRKSLINGQKSIQHCFSITFTFKNSNTNMWMITFFSCLVFVKPSWWKDCLTSKKVNVMLNKELRLLIDIKFSKFFSNK